MNNRPTNSRSLDHQRGAFTLIEMMAAVGLITILSVVGITILFHMTEAEGRHATRLVGGMRAMHFERQWREDVHQAVSAQWGTADAEEGASDAENLRPLDEELRTPATVLLLTQSDGTQVRYECQSQQIARTRPDSQLRQIEEYRLPIGRGWFEREQVGTANGWLLRTIWEEDPYPNREVDSEMLSGVPRRTTVIEAALPKGDES